jgi:hypothetical protein
MQRCSPQEEGDGFVDGSGNLFPMYLELAKAEDEKMADQWKEDADGILIFVSANITSTLPIMSQKA